MYFHNTVSRSNFFTVLKQHSHIPLLVLNLSNDTVSGIALARRCMRARDYARYIWII